MGYSLLHIAFDIFHHFVAAILCVFVADICSDGESRGYGHTQEIHLGEVSTFATEDVAHRGVTFGFSIAECIDLLCH